MTRTYHRTRGAVGAALLVLFLLLPFFRVNGESAFRFDVPTLRLLFFGTAVWMEDFFLILVAVLALTFLTLFGTTLFGRIWCGWMCPQTVLVDLTPFLDRMTGKGVLRRMASYGAACAASLFIAASLVGYFVSPYDIVPTIRSGGTAATVIALSLAILAPLIFLDIVALRRTFCRTVCPYAKLQGVLFDDRTLIVAFDQSRQRECMQCNACVRACPLGIDIREGTQGACIHCAECVDACRSRMQVRNLPSLVAYVFGDPSGRKEGVRISLYLSGGLTAASVLLFLYLTAVRIPFDATIAPVFRGSVVAAPDGSFTNNFTLSLRNTGSSDLTVSLSVHASSGTVHVQPDSISLRPRQESIKVPLAITVRGIASDGRRYLPMTLLIRQVSGAKELKKPISILLPER